MLDELLEKKLKKLVGDDVLLVMDDGLAFLGELKEFDKNTIVLENIYQAPAKEINWKEIPSDSEEARENLEEKYLFSLQSSDFEEYLEEGTIDPKLKDAFEEVGFYLDDDAELVKENGKWFISESEDRDFRIEVGEEELNIYDEKKRVGFIDWTKINLEEVFIRIDHVMRIWRWKEKSKKKSTKKKVREPVYAKDDYFYEERASAVGDIPETYSG